MIIDYARQKDDEQYNKHLLWSCVKSNCSYLCHYSPVRDHAALPAGVNQSCEFLFRIRYTQWVHWINVSKNKKTYMITEVHCCPSDLTAHGD